MVDLTIDEAFLDADLDIPTGDVGIVVWNSDPSNTKRTSGRAVREKIDQGRKPGTRVCRLEIEVSSTMTSLEHFEDLISEAGSVLLRGARLVDFTALQRFRGSSITIDGRPAPRRDLSGLEMAEARGVVVLGTTINDFRVLSCLASVRFLEIFQSRTGDFSEWERCGAQSVTFHSRTASEIIGLECMKNLKDLRIRESRKLQRISPVPSLERVWVDFCRELDLSFLEAAHNIEMLDLVGKFTIPLEPILGSLTSLKFLSLQSVGHIHPYFLRNLPLLKAVDVLAAPPEWLALARGIRPDLFPGATEAGG